MSRPLMLTRTELVAGGNRAWPQDPRGAQYSWLWGALSAALALLIYASLSSLHRWVDLSSLPEWGRALRPEALPPLSRLLEVFLLMVRHPSQSGSVGLPDHGIHPPFLFLGSHATLQAALARTALRVLLAVLGGAPPGICAGLIMAWSQNAEDYAQPVFILFRSIPPLALIAYLMLWLGHGEAHVILPAVYAVFTVLVVASYHALRDVPGRYLLTAAALGLRGPLLWTKVLLPAALPGVLAGGRQALMVAWMTAVGAEMLMADDGIGHLLTGGGLWSSRGELAVDVAVVMVGIVGLATAAYLMDRLAQALVPRLAPWTGP